MIVRELNKQTAQLEQLVELQTSIAERLDKLIAIQLQQTIHLAKINEQLEKKR